MSLPEKLYEKVEKISDDISEMKVTVARQEENIAHHIKRTDLLEESLGLFRTEMEPAKIFVTKTKFFAEILGYASALLGFGLGLFQVLQMLF